MKLPGTFISWVTYYDHVSPSFPQAHEMVSCILPEEQPDGTAVEKSFPLQEVKADAFDELQNKRIAREDFFKLKSLIDAAVSAGNADFNSEYAQRITRNLLSLSKA